MAAADGATDKRDALARRRKASRMRTLGDAFAVGCLLGGGIAHLLAVVSAPRTEVADPDRTPPAILAVVPPEDTFLAGG